jgi:hypothetical protein
MSKLDLPNQILTTLALVAKLGTRPAHPELVEGRGHVVRQAHHERFKKQCKAP